MLLSEWSLGFLLYLLLSWLILIDILIFLDLAFQSYDEIFEVLQIEVPFAILSLLFIHSLSHLQDIELLLDYLVHDQISGLVLLAYTVSLAEVFKYTL